MARLPCFFVTPTAYLGRDRWTMPFGDAATNARTAQYLRNEATVFNGVGSIWAPKYRQATFGAFLTAKPDAGRALDLAYTDVERAFAAFVAAVPAARQSCSPATARARVTCCASSRSTSPRRRWRTASSPSMLSAGRSTRPTSRE